ncbi:MAG: HPr family phosphocarrier protein [Pyrinomonadaceae bacterium]
MLEREVEIRNALGLHARAAAQLVRLANHYRSTLTLRRSDNGVTANAKSILSVLHIAAAYGTTLVVIADGEDGSDALDVIEKLFQDGFGEI